MNNVSSKSLYSTFVLATFLGLGILDRTLKLIALANWQQTSLTLRPWLLFGVEENLGLAWGIGSSNSGAMHAFFVFLMGVSLLGIAYKALLEWCAGKSMTAEILIFIGGLSNLIDRIQYGAVVDFVQIFIGNYRLSVFNLADIYIVVGLLLLLHKEWFYGNA